MTTIQKTATPTIPVTGLFLALVMALDAAKTSFINESLMAEEMGTQPPPAPYDIRCAVLFCVTYEAQAKAAGLTLTQETLDALLGLNVPEVVKTTPFRDLPSKFTFHPQRGIEPVEPTRMAA